MRRYKAVYLLLALTMAAPAAAEVPELAPLNYQLKYEVTWNNLPIGRVRMSVTEDQFRYKMVVDTKTRGIVRLFDRTESVITATGRFKEGAVVPTRYESVSRDDDSSKITSIRYDGQGDIKTRERTPADDPKSRPPVPLSQANDSRDPLTAMYMLRQKLRDNMKRNVRTTTVRTYDGARLADFTFKVISRARVKALDTASDGINTVMLRQPIVGYKEKELKKFRDGDPTIHVYFSADERLLPLAADVSLPFGTITATLVELKKIKD